MLQRGFGPQLDEHAREDVYANAWASSLSSLGGRIAQMTDGELRNYIFAAVTTHAGKELRRRRRKPTARVDSAVFASDDSEEPADLVERHETQRVLRDVLVSLPERRRRVITMRYAMGLGPTEICEAIDGLSARAYRKEITRGVKEVATKLGLVDSGKWCGEREQVIRRFANGDRSDATAEQAQSHLAHCASCAAMVRDLSGTLNDLGSVGAVAVLAGASAAEPGFVDRVAAVGGRLKEAVTSSVSGSGQADGLIAAAASSGGTRGGGSALIAGLGAKLGALGVAGKVAAGCLGTGAAMATCVAAGVVPVSAVDGWVPGLVAERDAEPQLPGHRVEVVEGPATPTPTLEPLAVKSSPAAEPDAESIEPEIEAAKLEPTAPAIDATEYAPPQVESSPEIAAATASPPAQSTSSSKPEPQSAGGAQASAQLGTP